MSSTTLLINTDPAGEFSFERPFFGRIRGGMLTIGTLEPTTFDVILTDVAQDITVHEFFHGSEEGVYWSPDPPVAVFGTLRIDVVGGGDSKHGSVRLMTET